MDIEINRELESRADTKARLNYDLADVKSKDDLKMRLKGNGP